jgi:hypothetical protein
MWNQRNKIQQPVDTNPPKTALINAFTECEKAMLQSANTLGFIDSITKDEQAGYEEKAIKHIKDNHAKKLQDKNMGVQLQAVFEGRQVEKAITQIRNFHYVTEPRLLSIFVLSRRDQFTKIVEILLLRKKIEDLKKVVNAKTDVIPRADFEDFISQGNAVVAEFKKIVAPLSNISDQVAIIRHITECETQLNHASGQITNLYPRGCVFM